MNLLGEQASNDDGFPPALLGPGNGLPGA
jgi:hypothetical protein